MKKNLMSVIILSLVFANLVLTALLLFTVLPSTKKANQMIEDVCAAIDLELNSGAATGVSNISFEDLDTYSVNGGESITMSFAQGADGNPHYLVAKVSLSMNKKSDNYTTIGSDGLTSNDPIISSLIGDVVHKYTVDDFNANRDPLYDEVLKTLQKQYGNDFIVSVNFSEVLTQ